MRWLLLGCLILMAGCLTPADRKQWDEAMLDLQGHNMKMRGETQTPYENGGRIHRN